jgi:hypothetical protein
MRRHHFLSLSVVDVSETGQLLFFSGSRMQGQPNDNVPVVLVESDKEATSSCSEEDSEAEVFDSNDEEEDTSGSTSTSQSDNKLPHYEEL